MVSKQSITWLIDDASRNALPWRLTRVGWFVPVAQTLKLLKRCNKSKFQWLGNSCTNNRLKETKDQESSFKIKFPDLLHSLHQSHTYLELTWQTYVLSVCEIYYSWMWSCDKQDHFYCTRQMDFERRSWSRMVWQLVFQRIATGYLFVLGHFFFKASASSTWIY